MGPLLILAAMVAMLVTVVAVIQGVFAVRWRFRFLTFAGIALVIGAAIFCFVAPAYAQTGAPAPADTFLKIPPAAWSEINDLIIGFVLALGALAWKYIDAHSPLKNTQAEQLLGNAWQDLLDKGSTYGLSQLEAAETKVGSIDVENAAIAAGANFVIAHGPDLGKKLGYDVTTDDGRAAVIRSVTLRVASALGARDAGTASVPKPMHLPVVVANQGTPTVTPTAAPLIPPSKDD